MSIFLIKFFFQYIHYFSSSLLKVFLATENKLIKSTTLFGLVRYESSYIGLHISNFILPLLINLSKMNIDIFKIIEEKKVVSIVSKLVLYSKEASNEYYTGHTTINLSEINNLYTLEDFHRWSLNIFLKLVKELELYNSFEKMSLTVQVKGITHISYEF